MSIETGAQPPASETKTPICFIVDEKYLVFAVAQALELVRTEPEFELHIFLEAGEPPTWLGEIPPSIVVHHNELLPHLPANMPSSGKWPAVVYGRIFLPIVLPHTRIIYMDADVARVRAIAGLATCDLDGQALGAVHDGGLLGESAPGLALPVSDWLRAIGLKRRRYFNSGVLVMDAGAWRQRDLGAELVRFQESRGAFAQNWDQDFLNYAFQDCWSELSPAWNYQAPFFGHDLERAFAPALVHFTDTVKPWHPNRFQWDPKAVNYYQRLFSYLPPDALKDIANLPPLKLDKRLKIAIAKSLYAAGVRNGRMAKARTLWEARHAQFKAHYGVQLPADSFRPQAPLIYNGFDFRCAADLIPG